tara:strand:+ start:1498 stop:2169 length:672 start_codon:yes stop_codon:yes gene_type:complete
MELEEKIEKENEKYSKLQEDIKQQVTSRTDKTIDKKIVDLYANALSFAMTETLKLDKKYSSMNVSRENIMEEDGLIKYFAEVNSALGNDNYNKMLKDGDKDTKQFVFGQLKTLFTGYKGADEMFDNLIRYGDDQAVDFLNKRIKESISSGIEGEISKRTGKLNSDERLAFGKTMASSIKELGVKADPLKYTNNIGEKVIERAQLGTQLYNTAGPSERMMNQYK